MFIRSVFISAPHFWGFQRYIDLSNYTTLDQVIEYILTELRVFLKGENLQSLIESLDDRIRTHGFHIEKALDYYSLLVYSNDPIYVCSH